MGMRDFVVICAGRLVLGVWYSYMYFFAAICYILIKLFALDLATEQEKSQQYSERHLKDK